MRSRNSEYLSEVLLRTADDFRLAGFSQVYGELSIAINRKVSYGK